MGMAKKKKKRKWTKWIKNFSLNFSNGEHGFFIIPMHAHWQIQNTKHAAHRWPKPFSLFVSLLYHGIYSSKSNGRNTSLCGE